MASSNKTRFEELKEHLGHHSAKRLLKGEELLESLTSAQTQQERDVVLAYVIIAVFDLEADPDARYEGLLEDIRLKNY